MCKDNKIWAESAPSRIKYKPANEIVLSQKMTMLTGSARMSSFSCFTISPNPSCYEMSFPPLLSFNQWVTFLSAFLDNPLCPFPCPHRLQSSRMRKKRSPGGRPSSMRTWGSRTERTTRSRSLRRPRHCSKHRLRRSQKDPRMRVSFYCRGVKHLLG